MPRGRSRETVSGRSGTVESPDTASSQQELCQSQERYKGRDHSTDHLSSLSRSMQFIFRVGCPTDNEQVCRGNVAAAATHLAGLRKMIHMRGGMNRLGLDGKLESILWL